MEKFIDDVDKKLLSKRKSIHHHHDSQSLDHDCDHDEHEHKIYSRNPKMLKLINKI